jgi:type II secretory pathway component GspD/PulD (secretin)
MQIASKKLLCRLTLAGVLTSLAAGAVQAQSNPSAPAANARVKAAGNYSIEWDQVPLGEALDRLRKVSDADVFVDRRVDPNQRLSLSVANASVEEIVARLAATCDLGECRLGELHYIGPTPVATRLVSLAAERRRAIAALPAESRKALLARRRIVWPRLTEPRELVVRLAADHDWRVVGGERIAYDLWAAGSLPQMTLVDQLTVLLAGFDLTFRVLPDQSAIEIVPVDWTSIAQSRVASKEKPRSAAQARAGKQVFTLRVENQPVGKVLEQLGQRLGWKLAVDEAAIRAAGRTLDARVSLSVDNADENQLLEALLAPAGLQAERDGQTVRVRPR